MAEKYVKKGNRKEYDGTWITDTFNFKISPKDFIDEEETKSFLSHIYEQDNISGFLKSAVIEQFRREKEGYFYEEIEEALTFQRMLKSKGKEEMFKKIQLFIELYGIEEIVEMIQNKGKLKEEEMAENIGKQIVDYMKQNFHLPTGTVVLPTTTTTTGKTVEKANEENGSSDDFESFDFD